VRGRRGGIWHIEGANLITPGIFTRITRKEKGGGFRSSPSAPDLKVRRKEKTKREEEFLREVENSVIAIRKRRGNREHWEVPAEKRGGAKPPEEKRESGP